MKNIGLSGRRLAVVAVLVVATSVALLVAWWPPHERSLSDIPRAVPVKAPLAVAPRAPATVTDPALGWPSAPGALQAAKAFARALLSVPPGSAAALTGQRCASWVTPSYLAQLVASPGAPVLAASAQPIDVISLAATLDDWAPATAAAPASAGVALGIDLRAGSSGPPSFLALDVHVVDDGGRWLVAGLDM